MATAPVPAKKLEGALQQLLQATAKQRRFRRAEFKGLVADQTITEVGHDFVVLSTTFGRRPPGPAALPL